MAEVYHSGPAGLIGALFDQLRFGKIIDDIVPWDKKQCYLSPGTRTKALVINILGGRTPLYMVDEFYEGMDTENLFGKGVKPEDLTDYHLARALDKIALAGPQKVFSTLAMHAISYEKIPVKVLHNDTTSVSVYGDFKGEGNLNITYGYSKSKRPDLKQFLYGLSVTSDKIPVCADVKDGNTTDKKWNFKFIERLRSVLDPEVFKKVIYVADSACVTEDNLNQFDKHSLRFISRLPGNFNLNHSLYRKPGRRTTGKMPVNFLPKRMQHLTEYRALQRFFMAGNIVLL